LGCLFLGEATLNIDPRLGRHATKQEALEHVRRCREAGLVHLVGRNKLDAVWLNVEPDNKLLTVCNCCPCCCLWRVLPNLAPKIGTKITKMPDVKVSVTDRCVGCGTCTHGVCFVDAIRVVDGRAVRTEECRGCGRCVAICPNGAIELTIENDQFVEEAVARISSSVDVT
jgi:Fe-S-cluster-containing hydrogenase component 2